MTDTQSNPQQDQRDSKVARQLEGIQKMVARLSKISTGLTAYLLSLMFFFPQKAKKRIARIQNLDAPTVTELRIRSGKTIRFHAWGSGPTVLFTHGWSGCGAQWQGFVRPFVAKGYKVVLFDAPAHGESPGLLTDTIEMASCITAWTDAQGPVHAIVAHSFGSGAALCASAQGQSLFSGLVCIGTPDPTKLFLKFIYMLKVPVQVSRLLKARVEAQYRRQNVDVWTYFALGNLRKGWDGPILLIQDANDEEIPQAEADEVAVQLRPRQRLVTKGLGHYRILGSQEVIDEALAFVDALVTQHDAAVA